jgi:hypothetical protein
MNNQQLAIKGVRLEKTTSIILLLITAMCVTAVRASESHQSYQVFFPKTDLALHDGEYIEEVHLKVACGHIEAITTIPDDWNIEVVRAISAVEEFHASAGHGGSRLSGIKKLNGAIQITVGEKACFDVSANILISGTAQMRHVELPKSKLKLTP